MVVALSEASPVFASTTKADEFTYGAVGADVFFRNFDVLCGAAGGIENLRVLVLELAVRGCLVPQFPHEGTGGEALERAQKHEADLVAKGLLRRRAPHAVVSLDERPFEIPASWVWTRFGELGDWGAGTTPARSNTKYFGGTTPWFKSGELNDSYVETAEEQVTDLALRECSLRLNQAGDVMIAMYGATIGKVALTRSRCTTNQAVCACTCHNGVSNEFLFRLLKAFKRRFIEQGAGGAQPNISKIKVVETPCPLPPLAEQKRIVAKVDQLMGLCDELETQQTKKRETGTRLTKSALEALTTAETPKDLDLAWTRVSENFTTFFDKSPSIPVLRRALLDLAARGRLTSAKAFATDVGVRRDGPFPIPAHWNWMTGRSLFSFITSGSRGWAQFYADDGPLFLRIGNLDYERVEIDLRNIQRVDPPKGVEGTRTRVAPGDVLVSITGDTGMVGLVPHDIGEAYINQHIALCRPNLERVIPEYVARVLTAPALLGRLQGKQRGIKNSLGLDDVRDLAIPVPPLSEQRTLLAQLRKFMELCDRTERQFVKAEALADRLSIAVVADLKSGDSA